MHETAAVQKRPAYRGRFAPSPTGPLHLGSLFVALGSWLLARHHGGVWLLRIEDIDPPREVPGAANGQIETLKAFGLESDEPVLWQHTRRDAYAAALDRLKALGAVFPCACSRAKLDGRPHRGRCVPPGHGRRQAWRLDAGSGHVCFDDMLQGEQRFDVGSIGDFVVLRNDGLFAYQLAVVVDDAFQGVTDVVRGADLLDSTPRQILVQDRLGLPRPRYAHLPALVDATGRKLGKSTAAPAVDPHDPLPPLRTALRLLGLPAEEIVAGSVSGTLLRALGAFDPTRLPCTDRTLTVLCTMLQPHDRQSAGPPCP